MAEAVGAGATFFTVMTAGQIEFADIPGCENAYCKYKLVHGDDWSVVDGMEDGISQLTRRGPGGSSALVWNFPVDVTYRSTNAFGWPQLVLSVYEVDALGRDMVRGYGAIHLPTGPGRFRRTLRLFRPVSPTLLQRFLSWVQGMPPEFSDPRFPARGDGREVTRVASLGTAVVQFNVVTKDFGALGYSEDVGGGAALDEEGFHVT